MKSNLSVLNSIFFGSLRPWLEVELNETKFNLLLSHINRDQKNNPAEFFKFLASNLQSLEIDIEPEIIHEITHLSEVPTGTMSIEQFDHISYPPHFNKTSEFFYYLTKYYTISIIHSFTNSVEHLKSESDKKYKAYKFLETSKNLLLNSGNPSVNDKLSTLVLNYARLSLFYIHFTIQTRYSFLLENELVTFQEALNTIAPQFDPEGNDPNGIEYYLNQCLKKLSPEPVAEELSVQKPQPKEPDHKPDFIPRKEDFRPGYSGKLSWDDIIKKNQFSLFEERLCSFDFIDADYNFTGKHNLKKQLAAIYRLLIAKGYFKTRNFKSPGKDFDPSNYRQYLDHRYNVDTAQQFSRITQNDIDAVDRKYYWIKNL